jgi:hypothetical protein
LFLSAIRQVSELWQARAVGLVSGILLFPSRGWSKPTAAGTAYFQARRRIFSIPFPYPLGVRHQPLPVAFPVQSAPARRAVTAGDASPSVNVQSSVMSSF